VSDATLGDVLIALARLEAKQDAMMSAIERLREETDVHWKKIADLESKLAVLESQRAPRVHWITILVGIIAVVGFGLAIFDRLYTTTP
jgi:septal ring factor EnvC (AmiA/AmiB activator)